METVIFIPHHADAVSSFHLSHVRSLLRNVDFALGGATDRVPYNTERTYCDRVFGHVTVILPGGDVTTARAFEAMSFDEVPSSRVAHGILNGTTYWFRCGPPQGRNGEMPRHRTYFLYEGRWLFFYTEGTVLPFGSVVNFSEAICVPETSPEGAKLAA